MPNAILQSTNNAITWGTNCLPKGEVMCVMGSVTGSWNTPVHDPCV